MVLWLPVILLAGVAVALVAAPLVRRAPRDAGAERAEYDLGVYKDQLGEVDKDLERGLLSPSEAEAARIEVQRRMLAAADAQDKAASEGPPRSNKALAAIVMILVPAGAVMTYLNLGSPGIPDAPFKNRPPAAASQAPDMDDALSRLKQRLAKNPKDLDGWMLLGRSYLSMGRFDEARDAMAQAVELAPDDPDALGALGEVLVMGADGVVTPEAKEIFAKAGSLDPRNPTPRYYKGLAKMQRGDGRGALQEWVDLIAVSAPDAPWVPPIRERVAEAASALGLDASKLAPSEAAAALGPPGANPVEAMKDMTPEERDAFIRSMVERLAQRMEENPDDADGWERLGKAYKVLGEDAKSEEALERARALREKN